jgi:DNA processing protein
MSATLTPELRDLLTLHLVPGLGPRLTAALLERFGSAAAILKATPEQLGEVPRIGEKLAHDLHKSMQAAEVETEIARMAEHHARLLALGTPSYPTSLAAIDNPPHLLYMRGELQPGDGKAVAIVGSRSCTSYGKRNAERMARELARRGYTIVSGLARGIDGVAHRAALDAGGRTVAVLAGGLSRIYPPEHTELAQAIEGAGALLSEALMDTEPRAELFPPRNRIISGLSQAVIIVEAAQRSGALITASRAAEQGRPVFAVPGPVDSPASGGVHELIRKGAILVRGVEDVLEELEGVSAAVIREQPSAPPPQLEKSERQVWDFLSDGPRHLDEMVQQLHLSVPQLSGMLMMLEMRRVVRRLPGNRFERT